MANWKVTFGTAASMMATVALASAANAQQASCEGVFEVKVPFCLEECGQDKSLLDGRRAALRQGLNAADADGNGRVAVEFHTTARRDESDPNRFMNGRRKFLERESGHIKTLEVAGRTYAYTTQAKPYGLVRAADTAQQLQNCPRR